LLRLHKTSESFSRVFAAVNKQICYTAKLSYLYTKTELFTHLPAHKLKNTIFKLVKFKYISIYFAD